MAAEPKMTADVAESTSSETGSGLEANLAGALAYLLSPLTGILFFLLEGENEFVKFHAAQSIVFGVGMFAIYIGMSIFQMLLLFIPHLGGLLSLLFSLAYLVVGFVAFLTWLFLMYKAYSNERFALPVFGRLAERLA